MAITRRGKAVASIGGALAVLAVGGIALALTGHAPASLQRAVDAFTGEEHTKPPPTCPLTGMPPKGGEVPHAPVVAVKVENTSDAYPLVGLQNADVVYEEIVEGGITRFMALFQCKDGAIVGPVRSVRTTDPKILVQFSDGSVLAYSGGQKAVLDAVERSGLVSLDESAGGAAFWRDPERFAPHDLFVSTTKIRAKVTKLIPDQGPPRRVFSFDAEATVPGRQVASVTAAFSSSTAATWRWMPASARWQRQYEDAPMTLDTGQPITATNVLIQQVEVTQSNLVDVLGYHSPEVTLTGSGKAWILRDGVLIKGTWIRPVLGAVTKFLTKSGEVIPLMPGNTWVELIPTTETVTFTH